ncbi:hypothetical protein GCM10010149_88940 [Nonomuraea roseoviolacea subsp. roseoviolacea]
MDHEFYFDNDALYCCDCDKFIRHIDTGDYLGSITLDAEAHVCKS